MLEGKRIFISGGAGFIGTTLARELVDRNEVVAYDSLHRDSLSGTDLGDHPNFTLVQGDILDAGAFRAAADGATHFVHCAAIAGVDTVLQSPVRVMRVNVIGTYNALEAAIATLPTLERYVDFSTSEVFGTHALNVEEGHVSTIGSVGEARRTYAVRSSRASTWPTPTTTSSACRGDRPPVQHLRPRPDRRRRDSRVHRGRARRPRPDDSRRRLTDPRVDYVTDMVNGVLACLELDAAVGQAFNIGNPRGAVTIFDLAQRIKRICGADVDIGFQPLPLRRRRAAHPERREGARGARLGAGVELDEGLVQPIAWYRTKRPAAVA